MDHVCGVNYNGGRGVAEGDVAAELGTKKSLMKRKTRNGGGGWHARSSILVLGEDGDPFVLALVVVVVLVLGIGKVVFVHILRRVEEPKIAHYHPR